MVFGDELHFKLEPFVFSGFYFKYCVLKILGLALAD